MKKSNNSSKIQVDKFIKSQEELSLLKFITCGSVDDGKSTLIGRILFESHSLFESQINDLSKESKKYGTQGKSIDYALLLDGLLAEREQGITIDVAYKYFSTSKRKFIVADTPGHKEYTRNMVTGASTSDLAIILVDARKGILEQTKRHSFLISLMGIKNIVLAVNKMDLVNFSEEIYENIVKDFNDFCKDFNFTSIYDIPISALNGDNISTSSNQLDWFKGPALIPLLETIQIHNYDNVFTMPVQYVIRPNLDYRAYSGKVTSGTINKGDKIISLPSGKSSSIKSIYVGEHEIKKAFHNQSISITLNDEIDISRGDVICKADEPIEVSNIFEANLSWLSDNKCFKGRSYIAKIGTKKIRCQLTDIKFKYDINTLHSAPAKYLELNDIANVVLTFSSDMPFTKFTENHALGRVILIDQLTNQTVAAATINHNLRRGENIHKHEMAITKKLREKKNGHKGMLLWFTGLSGSGKSTIANALEKELYQRGMMTYILDGDNVRHGLNNDLGFTEEDRIENIRRVGEVSKLMVDAGLIVLSSFISPFSSDRKMIREMFKVNNHDYIEIYLSTPLSVAESRDPKGLYKKARAGKIPNFTGISSPYEAPKNAEISLDTSKKSIKKCVDIILEFLKI
jgi:bifunctional enzyme CysN/CysC